MTTSTTNSPLPSLAGADLDEDEDLLRRIADATGGQYFSDIDTSPLPSLVRAFLASGDFVALRRAIAPPSCREEGAYYYSRNGGTAKARSPGHVANIIRDAAIAAGAQFNNYPVASWCGRWPRTVAAATAEANGRQVFRAACKYLAAL